MRKRRQNSPKNLSPKAYPSLYLAHIPFLLICLCLLSSCAQAQTDPAVDSDVKLKGGESQDIRTIATTPSHILGNRLGKKVLDGLNGTGSQEESEASSFTPLQSNSYTPLDANQALAQRVGERTSYSQTEDTRVIDLQTRRVKKAIVTCTVRVFKLLKDDLKGSKHQRFLVKLSNNTTVLVAHNIDLAPKVPIRPGDIVEITGEYIWNPKGGVLHYTHHSTSRRHPGGYILFNGNKYQ